LKSFFAFLAIGGEEKKNPGWAFGFGIENLGSVGILTKRNDFAKRKRNQKEMHQRDKVQKNGAWPKTIEGKNSMLYRRFRGRYDVLGDS
jgi:hypothetical protein